MIVQLNDTASPYSVCCYSSSGFDSLTAKKALADRIVSIGKPAVILHLGDHDPSGVSLFDAVAEDVEAFVNADRLNGLVEVAFHRVALTAEQVKAYDLPTAPAKATDSRSKNWTGGTCQLEALPPDEIAILVADAIKSYLHMGILDFSAECEAQEREELTQLLLTGPISTASRNNDGGAE